MAKATAIIPGRMGSTRFPGKALAAETGAPMVVHVCQRAALAESVGHIPLVRLLLNRPIQRFDRVEGVAHFICGCAGLALFGREKQGKVVVDQAAIYRCTGSK